MWTSAVVLLTSFPEVDAESEKHTAFMKFIRQNRLTHRRLAQNVISTADVKQNSVESL